MAKNNGDDDGPSRWALLGRRLTRPVKQVSFYVVLLIGIGVIGYLAVWIEEVRVAHAGAAGSTAQSNFEPLRLAYATAILAVGAPCLMQLIYVEDKIARVIAVVLGFVILTFAYCVDNEAPDLSWIHLFGRVGLLLATGAWWLANGEDELFQDMPTRNAPSGGDPHRELTGGDSGVTI